MSASEQCGKPWQFARGNQAARKRLCLWCKRNIADRRPEARFCSPSHKAQWWREKSQSKTIVTHKTGFLRKVWGWFCKMTSQNRRC